MRIEFQFLTGIADKVNSKNLSEILDLAIHFAKTNKGVLALGLCGSWARGTAGEHSDIDLSIIVTDKKHFRETDWLSRIPFETINDKIDSFEDKVYGNVWSRHVLMKSNAKIEFSFADTSWANIEPLDVGTQQVVSDGYKILFDPHQILSRLLREVNTNP